MPDRSLRSLLFAGCLVLSLCALSITPVVADDTSSAVAPTGDAAPVAPALPTADDNDGPSQHLAQRLGTISVVEMRRALQSLPRSLERRRQYASHFGIKRAVRELF